MSRIFLSAGEASGENYGAQLIAEMKSSGSGDSFFGLGGTKMAAAGCEIVVQSADVAVVGLVEVVKHLPEIRKRFHELLRAVDEKKPDCAILIDFPDFNFRLARELKKRGIPVVYFVSPQLWAWRKGRIKLVQKYVDKMLVIFPFEEEFYRKHGVEAEYVGHPLADLPATALDRAAYAKRNGLDAGKPWIALLPGSRKKEVELNLPEMLGAAVALGGDYEYLLPVASTLDRNWMEARVAGVGKVHLVEDAPLALGHARASVVASGTATVEAALAGNPFVVVYRVTPLTWILGRRLVDLPNFAMVNLIAGKTVVPELIQDGFTAASVAAALRPLLEESAERERMVADLKAAQKALHNPSDVTAMQRATLAVRRVLQGSAR
jgi:lipid-A-disaccharide synthase